MTMTVQQSYHNMAQSLTQMTSSLMSVSSTGSGPSTATDPLSLVSALEQTANVMKHLAHMLQHSHNNVSSSLVQLLPPLHHSNNDSFLADSYSTFDDSFMVPESSSPLSPHPSHEHENPVNVDEYDEMMVVVKEEESRFPFHDEPSSIVGPDIGGLASSSSEIGNMSSMTSIIPKTSSNPSTPINKKKSRFRLIPSSTSSSSKSPTPSGLVRQSRRERPISKRMKDSLTQVQTRPISKPTMTKPSVFGVVSNIKATKSATPGRPLPLHPIMKHYTLGPTGRLMSLEYWELTVPKDKEDD